MKSPKDIAAAHGIKATLGVLCAIKEAQDDGYGQGVYDAAQTAKKHEWGRGKNIAEDIRALWD